MNQTDIFRELIRFYRLEKPIPMKVHKDLLKARRETLLTILEKQVNYGLFILLIINLFFFAKRIGISISIIKSTLIIWTISLAITAAITISSYYLIRNIIQIEPPITKESLEEESLKEKTEVRKKIVEVEKKKISFVNITKKNGEIIKGQIISDKNGILSIYTKRGKVIKIEKNTIWKIKKQ